MEIRRGTREPDFSSGRLSAFIVHRSTMRDRDLAGGQHTCTVKARTNMDGTKPMTWIGNIETRQCFGRNSIGRCQRLPRPVQCSRGPLLIRVGSAVGCCRALITILVTTSAHRSSIFSSLLPAGTGYFAAGTYCRLK
jgi:hypothetical protein